MISHIQMITIYVSDLETALNYYTSKLNFVKTAEFKDEMNHLVWVIPKPALENDYSTEIALYSPTDKSDPRIGSAQGIVFTSTDIEKTYNQLLENGVKFTKDLIRHPYGKGPGDQEAQFIDPDGNLFILHT
jgi:catechol 2,3-dioxygenase-like lactoylglutathione lyase family enzyme